LAFKPDTDDMRSAPSIGIIKTLQNEGAKIRAYDPEAMSNAKKIFKGITYCKDSYAVAKGCDCLLLLTEWDEFEKLNFRKIGKVMNQPIIFDGRNIFDKEMLESLGFEYHGIGRGKL
jgi:UDPglucose 6-dehydrogenase